MPSSKRGSRVCPLIYVRHVEPRYVQARRPALKLGPDHVAFLCIDNLNKLLSSTQVRSGERAAMFNATVRYWTRIPVTADQKAKIDLPPTLDRLKATADDLMLDSDESTLLLQRQLALIATSMASLSDAGGILGQLFQKLPEGFLTSISLPTAVHNASDARYALAGDVLDESKISDMIKILKKSLRELGIQPRLLADLDIDISLDQLLAKLRPPAQSEEARRSRSRSPSRRSRRRSRSRSAPFKRLRRVSASRSRSVSPSIRACLMELTSFLGVPEDLTLDGTQLGEIVMIRKLREVLPMFGDGMTYARGVSAKFQRSGDHPERTLDRMQFLIGLLHFRMLLTKGALWVTVCCDLIVLRSQCSDGILWVQTAQEKAQASGFH